MTNGARYLPDSFKKSTDSVNYKLFQLLHLAELDAKSDLNSIIEYRNLKSAYGKTLDKYGEMVGVSRTGATDEQYRLKIFGKIARMSSNGTCNNLINLIADTIGAEPESISIHEDNMSIIVNGLTLDAIENTGCKSSEITKVVEEMIPAGVELKPPIYAGTLLVMGEVDGTGNPSVDAYGNYQYPNGYYHLSDEKHPTLAYAYAYGQYMYGKGKDIGLSGECNIPESSYLIVLEIMDRYGTYKGGTLGIISGDDEEV